MPTYGYECLGCDAQFEVVQSIKDAPLTTCDTCGGTLRKRIYPVGIAFKGSGFYVNDYSSKAGSSAGDVKAESAGSDSKPAETKPETSPAENPAAAPTKTEAPKAEMPKAETKA